MKKTQSYDAGWKKAEWRDHVRFTMTVERRKRYTQWMESDVDCWSLLGEVVGDGYRFSLSFNPQNDAYAATLTGQYRRCSNAGLSMTMHHADPWKALTAVLFMHEAECGRGSWLDVTPMNSEFDW